MKWRVLGGATALAAAAWSGWWFVSAGARDAALESWLEARRAEGWAAEAASLSTAGFPNRIDTRLKGLLLADPAQGWAWEAPFLDLLTLSYQPTRAVLAFPPEQTVSVPGERAMLRSEGLRASLRLRPGIALGLVRFSAEAENLALEGAAGWTLSLRDLAAHLIEAEGDGAPDNAYNAWFSAEELRPPQSLRERIGGDALPAALDTVTLDARIAFDAPLDRRSVEVAPPGVVALSFRRLEARWGELALSATGRVRADARGFAEGEVTVRAAQWRAMLRAAVAAGALRSDMAGAIESGLALLAMLQGGENIEVPLSFSGGRTRLGPISLGPAPRLM